MKCLLIGISAAASLLTTGALAADLPLKAPPVYTKAPVVPVYDWTGFYVGGNVGYSWANWDSTNVGGIPIFPKGKDTSTERALVMVKVRD